MFDKFRPVNLSEVVLILKGVFRKNLFLQSVFHSIKILFISSSLLTTEVTTATVHWDPEQKLVLLKEGVMETDGDAYGYLNDTLSTSGWSVLEIRAGYGKTPETDEVTFFLAGYLEGFLTGR